MRSFLPLFAMSLVASAPALAAETIPVPGFRSIELRGGGEVMLARGPAQRVTIVDGSSRFTRMQVGRDGKLRIDACNERCPANYRLCIRIESPRVPDVAISGGGAIRAEGFQPQPRLAAAVMGGGQIDLRGVDVAEATTAVHGGGRILVRPGRRLTAAVDGGGEIRYWGAPQVTMAVNGGGTVRPAN
jgi:hypothetical protein